jgi:hypothetical protein
LKGRFTIAAVVPTKSDARGYPARLYRALSALRGLDGNVRQKRRRGSTLSGAIPGYCSVKTVNIRLLDCLPCRLPSDCQDQKRDRMAPATHSRVHAVRIAYAIWALRIIELAMNGRDDR